MGSCEYGCPKEFFFPTTGYTYESTKDMHCPDTSYYVQNFLEVSECYEKRNTLASLETSLSQLMYLENEYEKGPTCIKDRDIQVVKESRNRLVKKIKEFVAPPKA